MNKGEIELKVGDDKAPFNVANECKKTGICALMRFPKEVLKVSLEYMDIPSIGYLDSACTSRLVRRILLSAFRGARLLLSIITMAMAEAGLAILSYAKSRHIDVRNFRINLPGDHKWDVRRQQRGLCI